MIATPHGTQHDDRRNSAQELGRRIQVVCDRLGSRQKAATAAAVSPAQLARYISGKNNPTLDKIVALAKAAGVSIEWLATGEGPMDRVEALTARTDAGHRILYVANPHAIYDVRPTAHRAVATAIPVYNSAAIAGPDDLADAAIVAGYILLSVAHVREVLKTEPSNMVGVEVFGDHMEPTIRHGALVLIDTSAKSVDKDGLYAFLSEKRPLIRRAALRPDGGMVIAIDNPQYVSAQPVDLTPEEAAHWTVLGRVAGVIAAVS